MIKEDEEAVRRVTGRANRRVDRDNWNVDMWQGFITRSGLGQKPESSTKSSSHPKVVI